MKKIGNVLLDIVIVIVVIAALAVSVMVISSKATGVPNIMGYSPVSVLTDSMVPEFYAGDLIIIKTCDPMTLKKDDIVTYKEVINNVEILNTHRIIEEPVLEAGGWMSYKTKGDNIDQTDIMPVYSDQIVGKYIDKRIPKIGKAVDFAKTQNGILVIFVIPLTLLFLWQLYKFIMLLAEGRKDKAVEAVASTIEEEKQKAVEEALAEQEAELERIKQQAVEEYLAAQKAANEPEKEDSPAPPVEAADSDKKKLTDEAEPEEENSAEEEDEAPEEPIEDEEAEPETDNSDEEGEEVPEESAEDEQVTEDEKSEPPTEEEPDAENTDEEEAESVPEADDAELEAEDPDEEGEEVPEESEKNEQAVEDEELESPAEEEQIPEKTVEEKEDESEKAETPQE